MGVPLAMIIGGVFVSFVFFAIREAIKKYLKSIESNDNKY